jgi:probable FeS assembly SUF system protein SufT
MSREEVTVTRDVEAVVIPAGNVIMIPEGTSVQITQSLGGSYTVITPHGYMARVQGQDADALGKEPTVEAKPSGGGATPTDAKTIEENVWDELRQVYDPEIPINIVDLGPIYKCTLEPDSSGHRVEIDMTMTAPGCGMGDVLKADAEDRIRQVAGVSSVQVEIVWDPPWDQSRMSDAARLELGFG